MMHRLRRYDVFRFAQNDVAPLRFAMMRCLLQNVAKPRIIRRSRHHWQSQHHLPNSSHSELRQTSLKMMHRLRRYDVFRFAQNDVAPLRSAMMRCLPQNVAKPRIIREANIIGRSPTSFAAGKHHSKNAPLSVDKSAFFCWRSV